MRHKDPLVFFVPVGCMCDDPVVTPNLDGVAVRSSEVSDGESWRGVRTNRYTLCIRARADGSLETELYDRQEDPYHLKNIALTQPGIAHTLSEKELRPWLKKSAMIGCPT